MVLAINVDDHMITMEFQKLIPRINTLNALLFLALLCLLLLLTSGVSNREPLVPGDPPKAELLLPAPADSMHVLDSTYRRTIGLFTNNYDAGAGIPLLHVEQELAWSVLEDLVTPDPEQKHALRFDYGLAGDSMRFGINVLELTATNDPKKFNYQLPDSLHALKNGALSAQLASTWRKNYQYKPSSNSVYFSKVRVRHTSGGSFKVVDYTKDPRAEVMAWEDELLLLHQENSTGHGDSTLFVVLRCVGKPDNAGLLQQRVCLTMRLRAKGNNTGPYRDLLDNSYDSNNLFRMHGADFGNMCPPGVGDYVLPPQ